MMTRMLPFFALLVGCDVPLEAAPEAAPVVETVVEDGIGMTALPVATLDLGARRVEFYEPVPGEVFVTETGPAGVAPVLTGLSHSLTATELFEVLQPHVDVPTALLELDLRAESLGDGPLDQEEDDDRWSDLTFDAGESADAYGSYFYCSPQWFDDTFCSAWGDEAWCWMNRTSSTSKGSDDVVDAVAYVCTDLGSVYWEFRYRTWWTWYTQLSWDVPQGYWRYGWRRNWYTDFDIQSNVGGVSGGDRYHHAGRLYH